jgi:hypothetical protein
MPASMLATTMPAATMPAATPRASASSVRRGTTRNSVAARQVVNTGLTVRRDWARGAAA